ncbi:MAG: hypothetical protein AAGF12_12165, partial [Myxococcota bacterium]
MVGAAFWARGRWVRGPGSFIRFFVGSDRKPPGVQGNRILIRNFRTAGASVVDPGSRLELNDL